MKQDRDFVDDFEDDADEDLDRLLDVEDNSGFGE